MKLDIDPNPGAPFGAMDPNSQHQVWSRWTFRVHSAKNIPDKELKVNVVKWLRMLFGSVGRVRFGKGLHLYEIVAEVEGVTAHDPGYVAAITRKFNGLVEQGWGMTALGEVSVKFLAGDKQDGTPRTQVLVMPPIEFLPKLFG